jgi:mono/diheme cytochrome c family protein
MSFQRRAIGGLFILLSSLSLGGTAYANGAMTYASRCSMCHQSDGAGLPGQFPRLSGRVAQIAASSAGRALLGKILLNGMYASIVVDGKAINGLMPSAGSMNDQDISDVLNFVVAMKKAGKPAPFTAAEITKLRAAKLSSAAVGSERNGLAAKGLVP